MKHQRRRERLVAFNEVLYEDERVIGFVLPPKNRGESQLELVVLRLKRQQTSVLLLGFVPTPISCQRLGEMLS
jgi:hypothetical protein